MEKINIICPCCEATLLIDGQTGAIISHEEKQSKLSSFEELQGDLDKKKKLREQIFTQEQEAQKDRKRLLDEKFQEAFKKADKDSDKPFRNPLDFD
jgi:hypothetical protein